MKKVAIYLITIVLLSCNMNEGNESIKFTPKQDSTLKAASHELDSLREVNAYNRLILDSVCLYRDSIIASLFKANDLKMKRDEYAIKYYQTWNEKYRTLANKYDDMKVREAKKGGYYARRAEEIGKKVKR